MHEVSLGGTLRDYLTGEQLEQTTYEDLRQALARYLVEERQYPRERLRPREPVFYTAEGQNLSREADIAVFAPDGNMLLMLVFCPGQVHTFIREVTAMARLVLPLPCPLALVTDTREAELFAVASGAILAKGLAALPDYPYLLTLGLDQSPAPLTAEQREKEGRILHMYTGLLKTCCGEVCRLS